jgi:signal peptidase I
LNASEPPSTAGEDVPAQDEGTEKTKPAKPKTDWLGELKSIFLLLLAVLAFHSFIAKPFYIPSESMMPALLKGDRLVVSKFPYGWSWVSPSFHPLPPIEGRVLGRMPKRGDIVIVSPPGSRIDYIKRVIGLPGDTIELIGGQVFINNSPVKREPRPATHIPLDDNVRCGQGPGISDGDYRMGSRVTKGADGKDYCSLPIFRETLPNGRSYDTIDLGYYPGSGDDYPKTFIPPNHVFLMGDNRDQSADSRVQLVDGGLGGPVPWENLGGRAEFITFSLDGSSSYWNPISWFTAMRGGRAGRSLHPEETKTK